MNAGCAVIVFAKAPVPGQVKTRLAAALGDDGAARLAARMLAETLLSATRAAVGPVELCCAPDISHPAFRQAAQENGVQLSPQGGGNLGERMRQALERQLACHRCALLIGTDIPALGPTHLHEAARLLESTPAVFVPAMDGGYVLVGVSQLMPRPLSRLFDDIPWSTGQVMTRTRARLRQLGIGYAELAPLADVDEAADLEHVPSEWLE